MNSRSAPISGRHGRRDGFNRPVFDVERRKQRAEQRPPFIGAGRIHQGAEVRQRDGRALQIDRWPGCVLLHGGLELGQQILFLVYSSNNPSAKIRA
jgi:hypothetical protein